MNQLQTQVLEQHWAFLHLFGKGMKQKEESQVRKCWKLGRFHAFWKEPSLLTLGKNLHQWLYAGGNPVANRPLSAPSIVLPLQLQLSLHVLATLPKLRTETRWSSTETHSKLFSLTFCLLYLRFTVSAIAFVFFFIFFFFFITFFKSWFYPSSLFICRLIISTDNRFSLERINTLLLLPKHALKAAK